MTLPPALLAEFTSIDAYLQAANEILETGHMPDLAGLDGRLAHLCALANQVDPAIRQECLNALARVLKKLDACEEAMRAYRTAHMKGHS